MMEQANQARHFHHWVPRLCPAEVEPGKVRGSFAEPVSVTAVADMSRPRGQRVGVGATALVHGHVRGIRPLQVGPMFLAPDLPMRLRREQFP